MTECTYHRTVLYISEDSHSESVNGVGVFGAAVAVGVDGSAGTQERRGCREDALRVW